MFSHVTIGVSDIDDAMTFYRQFMEVLGWEEKFATRRNPPGPWAGFHPAGASAPLVILSHPDNPHFPLAPASGTLEGTVVTFALASPQAVDAAHGEALALGGQSLRAPAPSYPPGDYSACIRDPFGNRLCMVAHSG